MDVARRWERCGGVELSDVAQLWRRGSEAKGARVSAGALGGVEVLREERLLRERATIMYVWYNISR